MEKEQKIDDCLVYNAVFQHPILFRDFWRPVARKERCYRTYLIQRFAALSNNLVYLAGRGIGKSIDSESWFTQQLLIRERCEGMMTAFRSMHMHDRFEAIIAFFYKIKYFRHFLLGKYPIKRQPMYQINLKNGVTGYGISIGDDPQAVNMTGKHPEFRMVEETQQYPYYGYIQFQGAVSPEGSTDRFIGVPDGRADSVFRQLDSPSDSMGKYRLHLSRRFNPSFTQEMLNDLYSRYNGEKSSDALNQIDAMWGEPQTSAWDIGQIKNSMILDRKHDDYSAYVVSIARERFEELKEVVEVFLPHLPYKEKSEYYYLATDVGGGKEPTVCLIFSDKEWRGARRFQLLGRVNLEKLTTPQSAKVLDFMYRYYKVRAQTLVSIDCTSGDGRSIADTLEDPNGEYSHIGYKDIISRVVFSSTVKTGDEKLPDGKIKEVKENLKELTWRVLKDMFMERNRIIMPYDTDILEEFGAESSLWNAGAAKYTLRTPNNVHIPEAFRCFAYLVWMIYEQEALINNPEMPFVFPKMAGTPSILKTG